MPLENQTVNDYQEADQEHKNRDPVDGIHVTYPAVAGFIRIFFSDIQIFGQLAQYSHKLNSKINNKSIGD